MGKEGIGKEGPPAIENVVADASALIGGLAYSGNFGIIISPLVELEVRGLKGIDLLIAAGLEVRAPAKVSLDRVREGALETGDDARLSEADLEILALALELGYPILSDDYSIQNLARHLGIGFRTVGEKGITREIKWTYRCKGCGKFFEERIETCPICGSGVKSARSRIRR